MNIGLRRIPSEAHSISRQELQDKCFPRRWLWLHAGLLNPVLRAWSPVQECSEVRLGRGDSHLSNVFAYGFTPYWAMGRWEWGRTSLETHLWMACSISCFLFSAFTSLLLWSKQHSLAFLTTTWWCDVEIVCAVILHSKQLSQPAVCR